MDKKSQFCLACMILALWVSDSLILANVSSETQLEKQWHQWRGPHATGVAPHSRPPTEWGPDKNIRWKTAIPGLGHATPIIWGETIWVSATKSFVCYVSFLVPRFNISIHALFH